MDTNIEPQDLNAVTITPMSEDDALGTAIIFHFWDRWIDGLKDEKLSPTAEAFLARYQAKKGSVIDFAFRAFEAGIISGLELVERAERLTEEEGG